MLYILAPQYRIGQEFIVREGLALSRPNVLTTSRTGGFPRQAATSTLLVLDIPEMAYALHVEQEIAMVAQIGVPVIRVNPNTMHDKVAVRPMEPSFEPPEFKTAEEAQEWLDRMSRVVERRR